MEERTDKKLTVTVIANGRCPTTTDMYKNFLKSGQVFGSVNY